MVIGMHGEVRVSAYIFAVRNGLCYNGLGSSLGTTLDVFLYFEIFYSRPVTQKIDN